MRSLAASKGYLRDAVAPTKFPCLKRSIPVCRGDSIPETSLAINKKLAIGMLRPDRLNNRQIMCRGDSIPETSLAINKKLAIGMLRPDRSY